LPLFLFLLFFLLFFLHMCCLYTCPLLLCSVSAFCHLYVSVTLENIWTDELEIKHLMTSR
jgi:hypothetical protein